MCEHSEYRQIPVRYPQCAKCGESYDITKTSSDDKSSCSSYAIEHYCPKCRPRLTMGQKAFGYAYVAGGLSWITMRELLLKPTVRGAKRLLKGLSDWAEK